MFLSERKRQTRVPFAGVVILALAVSCAAQTSRVAGAIQGSIVDQTGSAVAAATVTMRNLGTSQPDSHSTKQLGGFLPCW